MYLKYELEELLNLRSQQIRETRGIQTNNEWVERRRRRRKWDQHFIRIDAERLVKISRGNIPVGRYPGRPKIRRNDLIID